jgi:hypothetical protein
VPDSADSSADAPIVISDKPDINDKLGAMLGLPRTVKPPKTFTEAECRATRILVPNVSSQQATQGSSGSSQLPYKWVNKERYLKRTGQHWSQVMTRPTPEIAKQLYGDEMEKQVEHQANVPQELEPAAIYLITPVPQQRVQSLSPAMQNVVALERMLISTVASSIGVPMASIPPEFKQATFQVLCNIVKTFTDISAKRTNETWMQDQAKISNFFANLVRDNW